MNSENLIGILLWVLVILFLIFVIQNIRKRHIMQSVKGKHRFNWSNFILDLLEIVTLFLVGYYMINKTMFDDPDLEDTSRVTQTVKYNPLVMKTGTGKSSYILVDSKKKKLGTQTYTYYQAGKKYTVSSKDASVSYGKDPLAVNAEKIPYDQGNLEKADHKFQQAYVAIYTAKYKRNWQNGIGMHAGHIAVRYYLLRIPDASFIAQK